MKLSLNCLKKYVDLPSDLSLEQLAHDLTMKTVEVEGWQDLGKKFDEIVVGKIVSMEAHPDADKLRVCQVDLGMGENKQIVCGGSNLYVGENVVVSKPGSYVLWHGEGEAVKLKETKLRGVSSFGMICGAEEVYLADLYPVKEEHEIVDLGNIDCKPGQNIANLLKIDDCILEIDNKSLTNRPDLYCHYGMARELAAIYGLKLKKPYKKEADFDYLNKLPKYPVKIENQDACRRYAGMVIEGVEPLESPDWLKSALSNVGMRPINVIVDITNYIMIVLGQPTHAFDKNHIKGGITVRYANEAEDLELLDEQKINLCISDLMIADDEKVIGLAGIKGGKNDSVLSTTNTIVFEAANFSHTVIRKTVKNYDLRTESSIRFEKNIDTARVDMALSLAKELFEELLPKSKITAFNDVYPVDTGREIVELTKDFLEERLGRALKDEDIIRQLNSLGFETEIKLNNITVKVPTWRSTGDISLQDDILEEVARMIGYDNFKAQKPKVLLNSIVNQRNFDIARSLKEYLAFRCGFREVFTYPWVADKYIEAVGLDKAEHVKLAAPPAPEMANIRMSLVPGILAASESNLKNFNEFRIFELTQIFRKGAYSPSIEKEILPIHENHLVAACVGRNPEKLFYDVKGVAEGISNYLSVEAIRFESREKPTWSDKDAWLNIMCRKDVLGSVGLVSIKTLADSGIKHAYVAIVELNTDKLIPLKSRNNKFGHLPQYPLIEQDLSVTVDDDVKWSSIYKAVYSSVKEIKFMDEYRGKQIPEGKKSIMFRVAMGSDSGTLTSEQADKIVKDILKKLNESIGAEIRQ